MSEFINHHDPKMIALKSETLKDENIVFVNDYYRYVNHTEKLLTTGSASLKGLHNISNSIRFDTKTIAIMTARYTEVYPT